VLGAGKVKTVLEDPIGFAKTALHVAALVAKMKTDVAPIVNDVCAAPAIAGIFAIFQFLVHQRRLIRERFFDAIDSRQLVVIHFDQLHRFCRDGVVDRSHRGHDVAHVANSFGRENLLITHVSAERIGSDVQIVARQNR
jgi:hypothetical protein